MDQITANGHARIPVEILDLGYPQIIELPAPPRPVLQGRRLWLALVLFFLTLITTLAVGSEFALSYSHNIGPYSGDENPFAVMVAPLEHPHLLLLGIPFSFTLLGFLMAHEMGHFIACKIYGIDVSYPYFIPSPFLFGTFGAFLRIRSPIATRRALFDIGIAGPIAGFVVAVPLIAYGIAISKIVPGVQENSAIIFGLPPLLPVWQLDGGHILYSLSSKKHKDISLAVSLALVALGIYFWHGWALWGIVLIILSLRFRHPPVYDRWEELNASRKLLAILAVAIFVLCFTRWPLNNP